MNNSDEAVRGSHAAAPALTCRWLSSQYFFPSSLLEVNSQHQAQTQARDFPLALLEKTGMSGYQLDEQKKTFCFTDIAGQTQNALAWVREEK